jgi:hypothetical protein
MVPLAEGDILVRDSYGKISGIIKVDGPPQVIPVTEPEPVAPVMVTRDKRSRSIIIKVKPAGDGDLF